jgi:hypothetical protein
MRTAVTFSSAESEDAQEAGRRVAASRMQMPRRHQLEYFWTPGRYATARGDIVVQVIDEGGADRMVSAPGTVLNARKWRKGSRRLTFVYLEVPERRRISLPRLAAKLGAAAGMGILMPPCLTMVVYGSITNTSIE